MPVLSPRSGLALLIGVNTIKMAAVTQDEIWCFHLTSDTDTNSFHVWFLKQLSS